MFTYVFLPLYNFETRLGVYLFVIPCITLYMTLSYFSTNKNKFFSAFSLHFLGECRNLQELNVSECFNVTVSKIMFFVNNSKIYKKMHNFHKTL